MSDTPVMSDAERARRRKKNAKRKLSRKLCAEGRALPPIMGLSRSQFVALMGTDTEYDAYCDTFIAAAKKARRRWEFPLEAAGGVSFPSFKRHRKGMASGA